jgi:hypothetical protein
MSYKTKEYKGYTIEIDQDSDYMNLREEMDNLGTMVCFHSRYTLGDKDTGISKEELIKIANNDDYISLPLYLYDHSGITMNTTGFSCGWDSGKVGYIFVSKEDIRKEYSCKNVTKSIREKVLNCLRSEVALYDDYLTGNVFCYDVKDKDGESIDSCYGFYGTDFEKNGLMEHAGSVIDCYIKKELENGVQLELALGV